MFVLSLRLIPLSLTQKKAPPNKRMAYRSWNPDCKVYVGNLQDNCLKSDVEGAFSKFGPLKNVWVARNPPGFAFVEFEDSRDAEDACRSLDGTYVELSSIILP